MPIIGKGSAQNITDILYLRGVDVGIVQSDVLTYVRDNGIYPDIDYRIAYLAKLYNEEVHVLARKDITSLKELAGRKVNFANEGKRYLHHRHHHHARVSALRPRSPRSTTSWRWKS